MFQREIELGDHVHAGHILLWAIYHVSAYDVRRGAAPTHVAGGSNYQGRIDARMRGRRPPEVSDLGSGRNEASSQAAIGQQIQIGERRDDDVRPTREGGWQIEGCRTAM